MMEDKEDKKRKKSSTKSSRIDHTYYDYSQRRIEELLPTESRNAFDDDKPQKGRITFPMKLHAIVSNPEYKHIIRWNSHGRSWKILDKELLASVVCKDNFNHESFGSFNRSVNGWGFKRLMRPGPDFKSYYHELFLRGRPELTQAMSRLISPGKRIPDPNGEPNFYEIAQRFPLPDDESDADGSNEQIAPPRHVNEPAYDAPPPPAAGYAQAQVQNHAPEPYSDEHAAKGQRHGRYSYPPDSYSNPSGYATGGHGYPSHAPAQHAHAHGYGHYPAYSQPYDHAAGPYGHPSYSQQQHHHHLHNPYISPERHISAQRHYMYNQHQWHQHQQRHHPYNMYKSETARGYTTSKPRYEEQLHETESRMNYAPREATSYQHHTTGPIDQYNNSLATGSRHESSSFHKPPVIHQYPVTATSASEQYSHHSHKASSSRKYVFPSYGSSLSGSSAAGGLFENASLNGNHKERPGELDERKPAAKRDSPTVLAQEPSLSPSRDTYPRPERNDSMADIYEFLMDDYHKSENNKEGQQQQQQE